MLGNMVAITLIACTITGSLADVSIGKVDDAAALNYLTLLSSATKSSLFASQLLDIKKQLTALLNNNPKSVNVEDLLSKFLSFAKLICTPVTLDYQTQPLQAQKELEQLRMKLSPYTSVVNKQFSLFTEELKSALVSYSLELQVQLEKSSTTLNEMLKNIALDLDSKTMEKADLLSLAAYSERLQISITKVLDDLSKNLICSLEKMSEKIEERVVTLYESLTPLAENMQDALRKQTESMTVQIKKNINEMLSNILDNMAQLKNKLSFYTDLVKEENNLELRFAKKTLDLYMIRIIQKVLVFKDMTTIYGDILNQALLKQVFDLKQKLVEGVRSDQERGFLNKISTFINNTLLIA